MTRTARPSRQRPSHVSQRSVRRSVRGRSGPAPRFAVRIANHQSHVRTSSASLRRIVRATLAAENVRRAEISVAVVDNATIHRLNREYLNHDYPTDVLSFLFDSHPPAQSAKPRLKHGGCIDGEVVLSAEMAIESARRVKSSAPAEVALYLVHGLLHLCGYDDQTTGGRRAMRSRERAILSSLARGETRRLR
jgi:probable rRNA maturation factor